MRMTLRRNSGQTTLEYAILVIIIIGALLAINSYIKRGIQGRVKSSADDIGDQFDPGNTNYRKTTNTASRTSATFINGTSMTVQLDPEVTTVESSQNIANLSSAGYWGPTE